ncbi:MAG TPA: CARDB domain-containing protein, partial [Candidatus Thermoplasmatota archaeon]|nr:CARDB domain-containing protein [Candidatus Thermoplasmatota archaeon]
LDVLPATAADLIVRELAFAGVLVEGDEVEFRAIVENVGDRAAGEFVVQFRIGATVLGSVAVPGLPAGAATAPVAAPNWTARAGTWTLTAFADATDTVVERSETNNTRALGVAVGSLATLPDLVPESVDWGGLPLNEGDLTTIRVTIANLGGSPAGPTTTRFTLGTVAPVSTPALAAGDRTVLNLSWRASADAATLAIETDAEGDVRESNESNNVLEAAVDVLAAGQRPDLRLANLSAPEGNLFAGDTAVFSVIVRNDGNAPSPATTVRFSPADGEATPASSAAVPSLPPGGSVAVRSEAIPLRVGLAVVATADPDDRVRESNEDDNDATLALDVRVPPADLSVVAIEWEPRLPRAGETLLVHVRVENLGRGPARDVAVQFLVNDATIETRNLPAVASGAGATAEFTWAAVAGNHVLAAKANPARTVEETRHDNNERTQAVLVTSGGPPAPTPGAEAGAALATLGLLALALRRRLG